MEAEEMAGPAAKHRRDSIEITRPEKVLFPSDGFTKRDLVQYYRRIAATMLPHLKGRALAMQRFPDGIAREGFFQKRAGAHFPDWIKKACLPKRDGEVCYVVCNEAATLVYLAGQAVITPHAWLSRADRPNHPDQMIFDLDPSKENFRAVCAAAKKLHALLKDRGLSSFVKTTGSRGLHVLVPLDRTAEFDAVRDFARDVAEDLAGSDPEHLTTEARKNKRRGRIFIDTARNAYAQTAAPPYAVRPHDGAPVAAPLKWDELDDTNLKSNAFNIRNIFDRLKTSGDPWGNLGKHAHRLLAS